MGDLAATLSSLKTPPDPVHLEFNSNRLSYRYVTSLKIHIKLQAFNCCQERICSCIPMIKNHSLMYTGVHKCLQAHLEILSPIYIQATSLRLI